MGDLCTSLRSFGRCIAAAAAGAAAILGVGCATHTGVGPQPPATVSAFDLERYLGLWHEVARLPNSFQRDCAGDVSADYTQLPNGLIQVVNACRDSDGRQKTADGWARPMSEPEDGKLEVTFVSLFGLPIWLAAGDYWVIGLDRHYRWAVVGSPDRDYGWILARQPTLDRPTLVYLAQLVAEKGYDPCAFVLSDATTAAAPSRLCDL